MSISQILIALMLAAALLATTLITWKSAVAAGYSAAASERWQGGWHMRDGGRRHGRLALCAERDPSEAMGTLMRFAAAELELDTSQFAALEMLEPRLTGVIARLRGRFCVDGFASGAAPARLAAYAEGADLLAEELHLLQPAFAQFYASLDDMQQQRLDAIVASDWTRK